MTTDQSGSSGGTPDQDRAGSMRPDQQQNMPGRGAAGMGESAQGGIGASVPGGSDIGAGDQLGRVDDADLEAGDVGDLGGETPDVISEEDLTGDIGDDD